MGTTLGDIESKVLHDLDNQFGVEVNNARRDGPWFAYGDNFLNDPRNTRNRALVEEAVRLSQQDIVEALANPSKTFSVPYSVEKLVPYPVSSGTNRWKPTDLAKRMGELGKSEVPDLARDLEQDDDDICAWISRQSLDAIGRQPQRDLVRMVTVLMSGVITPDDVTAIVRICNSVTSATTMDALRTVIEAGAAKASILDHDISPALAAARRRP